MKNILFVCSMNRLRSPTAEAVFSGKPGIDVTSAGINPDAENPLTPDLVDWADIIFVMEARHRVKLTERFGKHLRDKRLVCLDIPDRYSYMDPNLIRLLKKKAGRLISAAVEPDQEQAGPGPDASR